MHLSELQTKQIVSMETGKNIGTIIDVLIDTTTGSIQSLLLETKHSFKLLGKSSDFDNKIEWKNIVKIGEDVILVKNS